MKLQIAALATSMALLFSTPVVHAQFSAQSQPNQFHDTSILKPPAGERVAVIEFEDLECPACAAAAPIVHRAIEQYHIPYVRYDFPLKMHVWSFDAAVNARYLQDKVNPKVAEDYRLAVFASQMSINSKDDLLRFTRKWTADHKVMWPFTVDLTGALANKIRADYALGERLNVTRTPTIVVATKDRYQVISGSETGTSDPNAIFGAIEGALAQTRTAAAPTAKVAKKTVHK